MLFDWEALLSLYYVEQTYLSICLNACLSDLNKFHDCHRIRYPPPKKRVNSTKMRKLTKRDRRLIISFLIPYYYFSYSSYSPPYPSLRFGSELSNCY